MDLFNFFLNRLKEPSTMASIGVVATTFGADPTKIQSWQGAATAILCLLGMFLPERR